MKKSLQFLLAGAFAAAFTQVTHAQTLVTFTPYQNTVTDPGVVAPLYASSVTAGALSYGPGFTFSATTGFPQAQQGYSNSFNAPLYGVPGGVPTSLADAVSPGESYFSFSAAPTAGNELNLTGVDFSGVKFYSNSETDTFVLESSVTGFGSSAGDILSSYTVPTGGGSVSGSDVSFLLSPTLTTDFTGLTSSVEFRLYEYNSGSDGNQYQLTGIEGAGSSSPTGFSIDGAATPALPLTPEPGTYALLGLGLALLVVSARYRRSSNI
jgi:hypothetical protein